jgi:uncharacterized protein YndB with AHSA1/START domain
MVASLENEVVQSLLIEKEILIAAPLEIAWEAMLEEIGPASQMPNGQAMPMVLEPWPGGRWFRDLGNNAGHFWGHVQVIKPPALLEITGPMFMSYPAMNHVQYRLTAEGLGTKLKFTHRGIGEIAPDHREGVNQGWSYKLERIQKLAESKRKSK